ncbi:MAG: GNVR domain-containing protein [Armatimonadota bacterium]|nr:GNVR domain-containing protein [Armatimonadota bacterium]
MELREYYEVLRKRVWMIILLVAVATGGVIYQVTNAPDQYQAEVSMLVTPRVIAPTAFQDTPLSTFAGTYRETVMANIALLVQSKAVLERVAAKVGGVTPKALSKQVTAKAIRGSDFLIISVKDRNPERAALIANTTARQFVSFYGEINRTEATSTRKFIENQLAQARQTLARAERALLDFKMRTGTIVLPTEMERLVDRALGMEDSYEAALLNERVARTRAESIQARLRAGGDPRVASVSIATNPVVGQLRDHLTQLELQLAGLQQVYTDQHPRVVALMGQIQDARERLRQEALRVVADQSMGVSPIREMLIREQINAEVDAVVARARATGVSQNLGRMRARLQGLPRNELTLARLQRDVRIAEDLFIKLAALHQEAIIRENRAASAGQAATVIVDLAAAPAEPVPKQLPLKAGMAGLMGIVLGAALALLSESLDTRIRSSREAEGAYGVPVLAAIPTINAHTHRQLTTGQGVIGSIVLPALLALLVAAATLGIFMFQASAMAIR